MCIDTPRRTWRRPSYRSELRRRGQQCGGTAGRGRWGPLLAGYGGPRAAPGVGQVGSGRALRRYGGVIVARVPMPLDLSDTTGDRRGPAGPGKPGGPWVPRTQGPPALSAPPGAFGPAGRS